MNDRINNETKFLVIVNDWEDYLANDCIVDPLANIVREDCRWYDTHAEAEAFIHDFFIEMSDIYFDTMSLAGDIRELVP